eukprot:4509430-Alexandrium_andersonii.AAC.1
MSWLMCWLKPKGAYWTPQPCCALAWAGMKTGLVAAAPSAFGLATPKDAVAAAGLETALPAKSRDPAGGRSPGSAGGGGNGGTRGAAAPGAL